MVYPLPFVVVDPTVDDRRTLAVAAIAATSTAATTAAPVTSYRCVHEYSCGLVPGNLPCAPCPIWVRVGAV